MSRTHRTVRLLAGTAVAGTLALSSPAFAEGWLLRIGFGGGGDDLFRATFENGDDETITAGDGVFVEGGVRRAFAGPEWDTDLTVGYKFDSIDAENGEVGFTRVTLGAMQFYRVSEQIRVGAGVAYHLSPELDIDAPGPDGGRIDRTVDFDDALGFELAADYRVNERFELGLRALQIDYEVDGQELGGDSVAFYVGFTF